jgi:hypothetical protein
MKISYKTNFSGYLHILRAIQLLIKDKTLNFTQFGVYICLIAQADFEKRHKRTYGAITRDDREIAKELGCDYTTIHKHRKDFIKKGLFIERDGLTVVPNFHLFEYHIVWKLTKLQYPVAKLHHLFANPQIGIEIVQSIIAKLQEQQPQNNTNSSSFSSKGNLYSSQDNPQEEIDLDEADKGIERLQKEQDGL